MISGKIATIYLMSALCTCADTLVVPGPFGATDGPVFGPAAEFALQDVSLTTPPSPGGAWTVIIHTNYGVPLPGAPGDVIPDWRSYAAADFLISWNGGFYAIVLNAHDGYSAGALYQADGFQTAEQVRLDTSVDTVGSPDVWLDAGGSLVGTGTVSAAPYGDGITQASYAITDTFYAPDSFLLGGDFVIQTASADCGNALVLAESRFPAAVPEPQSVWLAATAMLITCWRLRRAH